MSISWEIPRLRFFLYTLYRTLNSYFIYLIITCVETSFLKPFLKVKSTKECNYLKNTRRISTFRATSKFSLYFSGSCIPANDSLFILLALPTLAQTAQEYNHGHSCSIGSHSVLPIGGYS